MDNGSEWRDMRELCAEMEARQTFNVPETPPDNAGAERSFGVILRQVRIILAASGLSDQLWPYAFQYVCHVHNSLPSRSHDPPISPYEAAFGKLPNLDLIHTFGCLAYMPLSDRERADNVKTSSSRVKVVHLGFDTKTKGYFVYVPESKQYTTARGLHFNDDEYYTPPELARGATPLKKIKRKDKESDRPDSSKT